MEGTKSQTQMREELLARAADDTSFRARLVEEPKAAFKETFGVELPEAVTVVVHEDTEHTAHLVLPPSSKLGEGDLEAIAAGHQGTTDLYGDDPTWHFHPDTGEWHM